MERFGMENNYKQRRRLMGEAAVWQKRQLGIVERIAIIRTNQQISSGTLTLDSLAESFSDVMKNSADHLFKFLDLSWIVCSYATPLFIKLFQGWDPLENPSHGMEVVSSWKDFLRWDDDDDDDDDDDGCIREDVESPYYALVSKSILPAVKISGINKWDARDPEPMLRFLELWKNLLPSSISRLILDDVVMPKLSVAIDSWNPCLETLPIRLWVHPWLPLLGKKLEALYQTLRSKFSYVLEQWHLSEASSYTILSPWKIVFDSVSWEQLMRQYVVPKLQNALQNPACADTTLSPKMQIVFDSASWEQLMRRCIVPKLQIALQELEINPVDQKLDKFHWVMSWASVIPIPLMVDLMERFFFDKWLQALYVWLHSDPNLKQITNWYIGWKGLLPLELLADESIQCHLIRGRRMIDQAFKGKKVMRPENHTYFKVRQQFDALQVEAGMGSTAQVDGVPLMSLKEVVQAYAQQHGLLFKPIPGRTHNGLQMYGFGSVFIIVDSIKVMIYALKEGKWSVVSLVGLLELHSK